MTTTATTVETIVRNAPPATVAAASFTDWFAQFPISTVLQWASLIWILIQAVFYLYDKYRKYTDGSKL